VDEMWGRGLEEAELAGVTRIVSLPLLSVFSAILGFAGLKVF